MDKINLKRRKTRFANEKANKHCKLAGLLCSLFSCFVLKSNKTNNKVFQSIKYQYKVTFFWSVWIKCMCRNWTRRIFYKKVDRIGIEVQRKNLQHLMSECDINYNKRLRCNGFHFRPKRKNWNFDKHLNIFIVTRFERLALQLLWRRSFNTNTDSTFVINIYTHRNCCN